MELYLVRMVAPDGGETFFKVGVTKMGVKRRFEFGTTSVAESSLPFKEKLTRLLDGQKYISSTPYIAEEIHTVSYKYKGDSLMAEQEILSFVEPHRYLPTKPFAGRYECFSGESVAAEVKLKMNSDVKKRNAEAPSELLYKLKAMGVREQRPIERHRAILERCRIK